MEAAVSAHVTVERSLTDEAPAAVSALIWV